MINGPAALDAGEGGSVEILVMAELPEYYGAPGGLLGLALVKAIVAAIAAPAPRIAPTLINKVRVRLCFAGAMAIPAGSEAAFPVVGTGCAAAVPTGC